MAAIETSFNSFLGRGWAFPPTFDANTGLVEMVSDTGDIKQSLDILLSTSLGERVMQPDYGCNLHDYLFDSMDNNTIGIIKHIVENAILYYEPRIIAEKVEVNSAGPTEQIEGKFVISVIYRIPETNSRFNYVYDYYLNEASGKV